MDEPSRDSKFRKPGVPSDVLIETYGDWHLTILPVNNEMKLITGFITVNSFTRKGFLIRLSHCLTLPM